MKLRLYDKLICHFKFKEDNVIEIDDKDISIFFLEMYRSESIQSPDLVWNNSIKEELKTILLKEIELWESSQLWKESPYKDFEYSNEGDELVINGVFVKLLNKDIYFTLKNPSEFLSKIVYDLKNTKRNETDTFEIIMAMRNCTTSSYISEINEETKNDIFSLLPKFVSMEVDNENSRVSKISMLILETLSHAIKKTNSLEGILENDGLCQIMVNILYKNENERIPTDSILLWLKAIVSHPEGDAKAHLWNTGILGLLLRYIFRTNDLIAQRSIILFLLWNSNESVKEYGVKLISKFLPLDFKNLLTTNNVSVIDADKSPKRRQTLRKANYINLHGNEFEEAQNTHKSGMSLFSNLYSNRNHWRWISKASKRLHWKCMCHLDNSKYWKS